MLGLSGALILFLVGLRLSAFFSGSETGFYRVSLLRLSIDAHSGDATAKRVLWFVQNPSYFVATTLVGNNIANYLCTIAVSIGTARLFESRHALVEVAATLLLSPVIFIFGELVPKYLYFRSPTYLLRRGARSFQWFFRLFLVVSFPLIAISKLFQRLQSDETRPLESMLGRSRLVEVLDQGHQEGLLTAVQSRLVQGVLHTARQSMMDAVTPASRVQSMPADTPADRLLEHARRYGLTHVIVGRGTGSNSWYGYLRVFEVAVRKKSVDTLVKTMPSISASQSKLEALLVLRNEHAEFGLVRRGGAVVGIISERVLTEQLFRPVPVGASQLVQQP